MQIETGLILCAGFGKRVAPLTDKTPKPLLKIKNNVLLDKSINFLEKCGIIKIKINTHYLAQEIENFIRAQNYKIKIEISYENEILDTGGGIKNLIKNEADDNFLVLNPDTIWGDKYLDEVVQMENLFFKNNLDNILLLVKKSNSFDKRFNGDFDLNKNLISKRDKNNFIYTGCQILSRDLFKNLNVKNFSIRNIWNNLIQQKQLFGYESKKKFFHVTNLDVFKKLQDLQHDHYLNIYIQKYFHYHQI